MLGLIPIWGRWSNSSEWVCERDDNASGSNAPQLQMNNNPSITSPPTPPLPKKMKSLSSQGRAANAEKLAYIRRRKAGWQCFTRLRVHHIGAGSRISRAAAGKQRSMRHNKPQSECAGAFFFFFFLGGRRQIIKSKLQLFGENKHNFKPLFSQNIAFLQQLRPGGVASNDKKSHKEQFCERRRHRGDFQHEGPNDKSKHVCSSDWLNEKKASPDE